MTGDKVKLWVKLSVTLAFVAMITMNSLANIIPLNGITTGAVSDSYKNLFAPAGITFAVWGLIYILLLANTIYMWFGKNALHISKTAFWFGVSSVANALWIPAWHYRFIPLSFILIVIILICLILIDGTMICEQLSGTEKFFISIPFRVYFGWITVAVIANAVTLLVYLKWNGFGIAEHVWAVIVIALGMLIGTAAMLRNRSIAYGLVLVWAYTGILIRHLSPHGFAGQYGDVIVTTVICIAVFLAVGGYILVSDKKRKC